MKERFKPREWERLQLAPHQVFVLVACADGELHKKEFNRFVDELGDAAAFKNELHREIMVDALADAASEEDRIFERLNVVLESDVEQEIRGWADMLQDRLTRDEFQDFVASLWIFGMGIARATGGFLGFGKKINEHEWAALAALAEWTEVDLDRLQRLADEG